VKSSELHRLIRKNGWIAVRQEGSHIVYEKNGNEAISVPFHGSKETGKGIELKFKKAMGLK
jgi:predicted RNA binding protein YcfA (HicA-like mRNA interferase family)